MCFSTCLSLFIKSTEFHRANPPRQSRRLYTGVIFTYTGIVEWNSRLCIFRLVRKPWHSECSDGHDTLPLRQLWGKCLGQGYNSVSVGLKLAIFLSVHLNFTHWGILYKDLINKPGFLQRHLLFSHWKINWSKIPTFTLLRRQGQSACPGRLLQGSGL